MTPSRTSSSRRSPAAARRRERALHLLKGALALVPVLTLVLALAASSCSDGRFPVCKSNADCAAQSGGPAKICFNLKCVECQYDSDCPSGKACNRNLNECQAILAAPAPEETSEPETAWEPSTWDECAKGCKDKDCVAACDKRFKK